MDKSKEYLEMCECCTEIQTHYKEITKLSGLHIGDYYINTIGNYREDIEIVSDDNESGVPYYHDGIIWLPKQDQLQELMKSKDRGLQYKPKLFINLANAFLISFYEEYGTQPSSMEELWLRILMLENYSKVWQNGEWAEKFMKNNPKFVIGDYIWATSEGCNGIGDKTGDKMIVQIVSPEHYDYVATGLFLNGNWDLVVKRLDLINSYRRINSITANCTLATKEEIESLKCK